MRRALFAGALAVALMSGCTTCTHRSHHICVPETQVVKVWCTTTGFEDLEPGDYRCVVDRGNYSWNTGVLHVKHKLVKTITPESWKDGAE